MPDNCAAVIDELVAIRKERGMTQAQLAEAAALAQSAVARRASSRWLMSKQVL